MWQPSQTALPLEDYEFADRDEHEAAFEWAARIGPQLGMLAADILPPLPHTADVLAAWAALLDGAGGPWGRFAEINTARIDPRAPWRNQPTGLVHHIKHLGFLLIRAAGQAMGWEGILLRTYPSGAVSEHLLVDAQSRRPIRFDDRHDAVRTLESVVDAGGSPHAGWTWTPPAGV